MIMYGKENPMVYTPEEIFNPTTANMVLQSMGAYANALRQDYKDALDKEEQFMKEYGSFLSPIAADQENYYNATLGGFGKLYDAAAQQGVDLLRSQEGRSLILRYIMSRPYALLALLRQSAENAKQYQKSAAALAAAGKFDPEMAKYIDGDLSNWNTSKQGMWSSLSPIEKASINDLLLPTIEDLRKNGYDEVDTKSRPGYRVYKVSDKSLNAALNRDVADLMKDPRMKYYKDSMGMTDEQFKDILRGHMRADLAPKEEIDQYYKSKFEANLNEQAQIRNQNRQWAHEDKKAEQAHRYKMQEIEARYGKGGAGKNGKGSGDDSYSVSYDMYTLGLSSMDTSEDVVTKQAMALTDKKFKKYIKNGKMPDAIRNSRTYQDALLHNKRYVISHSQNAKVRNYMAQGHSFSNSSAALASGVGVEAMYSLPDVAESATVDTSGKLTGFNISGSKIVSLDEISYRRGDGRNAKTGKKIIRNFKHDTAKQSVNFQGDGNNFIQQIESDGRIHQYYKLKDGKGWYDAGIYMENQQRSNQDINYLNRVKQGTKAMPTPLPGGNYSYPMDMYDMMELYGGQTE